MNNEGTHFIKAHPEHFEDVRSRKHSLEICRNDRDYRAGDNLVLQEYDTARAGEREAAGYTGQTISGVINHVATSEQYPEAICPGFVVLQVYWYKGLAPVLLGEL